MQFKYTVGYVPSRQNIAACPSRLTRISASFHYDRDDEYVRMVATNVTPRGMTIGEIERASAEDEELLEIRKCWRIGDWSTAQSPYKLLRDEISVIGRIEMRVMRIVVPLSLRWRVLELVRVSHEGHQGIVKTKDRLRSKVWWPNMNAMLGKHCKKCLGCKVITPASSTPSVKTTATPTKAWRDLAVDLMDPFCTNRRKLSFQWRLL